MVIWQEVLDNKYVCSVERVEEYKGKLTVEDKNEVLMRTTVTISYDAVFGPDAGDVNEWQHICMDYVDDLN